MSRISSLHTVLEQSVSVLHLKWRTKFHAHIQQEAELKFGILILTFFYSKRNDDRSESRFCEVHMRKSSTL